MLQPLIDDEMAQRIIEVAEAIATTQGAHNVTVKAILRELGFTNRVFYNRFHNIREVLEIVYENTIQKVRESIDIGIEDSTEEGFFNAIKMIVEKSLILSYDEKMQLTQYVFENDSVTMSNYEWWTTQIKRLINYAKEMDYIRDIDTDAMSYSIWCFCRGFNADAVGRKLPKEEAVRCFRYSIGILLDGMRKKHD